MSTLYAIVLLTAACGALSALVAGGFLLLSAHRRNALLPHLVSFATGALLGAALLALLPHALDAGGGAHGIGIALVGGIIAFFVLEKLVLWRHCHVHDCEVHEGTVLPVLVGDAVHNFVDGAVIAAAVMTSVPLGVSTAIAVAAHEIPQEVGDFAILLHFGYSRGRALLLNVLSAAASGAGAIAAFFAFELMPRIAPYFLVLAAASFLYVAMADLIPGLHRGPVPRRHRQG